MALECSSGGTPCTEARLTQNSAITVTIDDLTEGLIVVSFTHSDNLYQGVLFQLNRERGIPSGISFAKEHVLGNAVEKCEIVDPSQITPLHQRHTYNNSNQGTCNGTSHSPISQPSLRRIIKPPARFKNARMSLRLRARPVLCAKCRSLCDDKADSSSGKDEPPKEDVPDKTDKSKKERPKLGKSESMNTTTSGNKAGGIELNGKLRGGHEPSSAVDPQDLRYESVGSTGVVENYWRRPLAQPLIPSTEETYARLRKHKAPSESGRENRKKAKTTNHGTGNPATATNNNDMRITPLGHQEKFSPMTTDNENIDSVAVSQRLSAPTSIFVTKSNDCDKNFPNTRSRKALNLKMCITKIAEMRNGDTRESGKTRGQNTNSKSVEPFQASRLKGDEISVVNPLHSSPFNNHSDSSLESTEVIENNTTHQDKTSSDEGSSSSSGLKRPSKKSKAWENRIRTKSTVPVRFRDESYLTKNIFNFNKRRTPGTNAGGDIPVLTISRSDDENTFKVSTLIDPEGTDSTVTTSKIDENYEDHDDETAASSVQSSPQHELEDNQNDEDGSPHSPISSSSTLTDVTATTSIKSNACKPAELIKTPTIKITFGSSGNGMVVQIPPKVAQHVESPTTTDLKAVKKAMKKAKKEAKRRRSVSPDFSPSFNAFSPDHHSKPERSHPSSPVMRAAESHEESDVSQHHEDKLMLLDYNSTSEPSTSVRVPKKKKKQKKRRRNSKVYKENDDFASSSSHEPIMVTSMSSPHSNSSSNHDNSYGSQESPGGTSVKSCNMSDSTSHSVTQESAPSLFKDNCPPRRRRSMPATSTTPHSTEAPRVCINLKRVDTNHFIPLPLHNISSHSDNEDNSSSHENNGVDTDEAEINDFPVNDCGSSHDNQADILGAAGQSLEYYKDNDTENSYRVGDIVWGKLPATPWWPAKIDDILTGNGEETRAKVSWYKSTTQSCMQFKMLVPFTEYFDSKYARSRRRGLYQHAVKDAMVEAHRLNPEDLPTD